MHRQWVIVLILILSSLACVAGNATNYARVELGQTKERIRSELGQPDAIHIFKKQFGPIWGPEESFWHEIPDGTTLEVWRYGSQAGQLNLYFMEGRDTLAYKAFAPAGVVYESGK